MIRCGKNIETNAPNLVIATEKGILDFRMVIQS